MNPTARPTHQGFASGSEELPAGAPSKAKAAAASRAIIPILSRLRTFWAQAPVRMPRKLMTTRMMVKPAAATWTARRV